MKSSSSSTYLVQLFLLSSATALLWPTLGSNFWKNSQPSFTKICLYSNDPKQFKPMCIMCPNTLYPIVLGTCVSGAAIPLNVSYTQANCIVGNCAVNLSPPLPGKKGKREAVETKPDSDGDLDGPSLADLTRTMDGYTNVRSVPYTMVIDGHNVTITSVEEYFVHSDTPDPTDYYDLEI